MSYRAPIDGHEDQWVASVFSRASGDFKRWPRHLDTQPVEVAA